jgi:hypothetical protein
MAPLRWGIASAGTISFDFANALSTLPATDHQIVAVGTRNLATAKDFAKKFDIDTWHEGYENLVKDKNVGKWIGLRGIFEKLFSTEIFFTLDLRDKAVMLSSEPRVKQNK